MLSAMTIASVVRKTVQPRQHRAACWQRSKDSIWQERQQPRVKRRAPDHKQPSATPAGITINPATNNLTLNPSDTLDESIAVTIPKGNKFRNVNLVPSASIAAFVASINPPGGYGPITGEQDQTLTFRVRFHGIPCTAGAAGIHRDARRRRRRESGREERREDHGAGLPGRGSSTRPSSSAASSRPAGANAPRCSRAATPPRSTSTTTGSRKSRFRSGSFPWCWPARLSAASPALSPPRGGGQDRSSATDGHDGRLLPDRRAPVRRRGRVARADHHRIPGDHSERADRRHRRVYDHRAGFGGRVHRSRADRAAIRA